MLDSLAMPSPCWEQVWDAISGLALSSTQSEQAFWFALSRPHFCSTASMHLGLNEVLPPPIVWADMKRLKTLYIGGNRLPLPDHLNVHTTPQAF